MPAAERAADLAAIRDLPSMRVERILRRIDRALADDDPVGVQVQLFTLANDNLLRVALRSWALLIAELGPPRHLGGALVDEHHLPLVNPPGDDEPEFVSEFRRAIIAARDRDGAGLFASIARVIDGPATWTINYSASFPASAVHTIDQRSAGRGTVTLLHLLGHVGRDAAAWSLCGPLYRLVASIMAVLETGGAGAEAIEHELQPLVEWDLRARLTAMQMLGACAATIAGGDPRQPIDVKLKVAHPAGVQAQESHADQIEATRIGGEYVEALRGYRAAEYLRTLTGGQIGLGMYGCANMLACRVHELWGP